MGAFQRALDRGNIDHAEMAARELGYLSLIDALSLVVGFWLARLALEGRDVGLADVQLAAAALACLRTRRHEKAEKTLLRLL